MNAPLDATTFVPFTRIQVITVAGVFADELPSCIDVITSYTPPSVTVILEGYPGARYVPISG